MTILLMILALLVGIWLQDKFDLHWHLSERFERFRDWLRFRRV